MSEVAINPPADLLGVENAILTGRGRRYQFGAFAGPLSIKAVTSGSATWETPSGRFEVGPGCALVLNDGEEYTISIDSLQPVETFCVFFARGFVEDARHSLLHSSAALLDAGPPSSVSFTGRLRYEPSFLRHVAAAHAAMKDELPLAGSIYALATELVRSECDADRRIARLPALRSATRAELARRLRRGIDYIHANISSPIHLRDVASASCVSPFHFHRLFTAFCGTTPHRYISALRMARAQSLLRTTERSVMEIALECGFESVGSFTTLFSRYAGTSPARFRKNREETAATRTYDQGHERTV